MPKKVTLNDEKIVDDWFVSVEGGQGRGLEVYKLTMELIQKSEVPEITAEEVMVRPSWLAGLFGRKRPYLMVRNRNLKDYRIYIGAGDFGDTLNVSFYFTCEPSFLKRIIFGLGKGMEAHEEIYLGLDLFQQQNLLDYASHVHQCLLKAVEMVIEDLGQDSSGIDKKFKGFLGVT